MKEFLDGVLVKTLNFTEAEVPSLYTEGGELKENALEIILAKQAERVSKDRERAKAEREEQYKRGLREKGVEWEKLLKEAGVEIGDAVGADAVQKLKDHIEAQIKPSELDDDKVKNSSLFRKREKELTELIKQKEEEFKQQWAERDAKEQRERTLASVKGKAKTILDELKPILSDNPAKAANQLRLLEMDVEAHSYEIDGDDILIKDSKGERLENANGTPMTLADFVKTSAEKYYDFAVSEKKGSAGNPTPAEGVKKLQKPATREALAKEIHRVNTDSSLSATDRAEMLKQLTEWSRE